jgi:glutaredoxin
MIKIFKLLIFIALTFVSNFNTYAQPADIELFSRESCPHCIEAKKFLTQLQQEQPHLRIVIHDIEKEPQALTQLKILAQKQNVSVRIPAFYLNQQLIIGFTDPNTTGQWLRSLLAKKNEQLLVPQEISSCEIQQSLECNAPVLTATKTEIFELNFLGQKFILSEIGLPFFTIMMGLLDGFNPCSMWVLILMISLLSQMQNRRRMFAIAGTFVVIEGLVYFLFMSAWLNLFLWVGLSRISEIVIALIALTAGMINLKDFLFFGRGVSLSISRNNKTDIYLRIRQILYAKNLIGALVGVIILALLVQLVEFMCTSGFPALYTRILTLQQFNNVDYYSHLLLYNMAYMFDDFIILSIGVITLSQHRLQEKEGRVLKLISGLVMVSLGVYLLYLD